MQNNGRDICAWSRKSKIHHDPFMVITVSSQKYSPKKIVSDLVFLQGQLHNRSSLGWILGNLLDDTMSKPCSIGHNISFQLPVTVAIPVKL